MKKITLLTFALLLLSIVSPIQSFAKTVNNNTIAINEKAVPAEVQLMLNRLDEIKAMDKSTLTRVEKKELRAEVRTIKNTLRSSGNGVYLSVGAIIIIILLLILLL